VNGGIVNQLIENQKNIVNKHKLSGERESLPGSEFDPPAAMIDENQ